MSRAGLWYEPAQAAGTVLGSAGIAATSSPVVPALPTSRGVCLCALKTLLEVFHLFICLFSFPECPGLAKLFFTVFRNISSVVCQLQAAGRAGCPQREAAGRRGHGGLEGVGKGREAPKGGGCSRGLPEQLPRVWGSPEGESRGAGRAASRVLQPESHQRAAGPHGPSWPQLPLQPHRWHGHTQPTALGGAPMGTLLLASTGTRDALESHVPAGQAAVMPSPKVPVSSPQDATPRDGGIAHASLASFCMS